MAVSVPLPDELAHRLEVEAARRGMTPEELAAEMLQAHLPAERGAAGDALDAFFGIGDSSSQEPFDIKRIRREIADRKLAEGA
jgi:plasmid stability protein